VGHTIFARRPALQRKEFIVTAKRGFATLVATVAFALAGVSSGVAANNSNQTGLVNVSAGDVNLLNNVNLAVAANVAANACGINVPIAILATQVATGGQDVVCTIGTDPNAMPITITQSQNGAPALPPGGNNSNQSGLVNVSLGDVNLLNNLNAAIGANIGINVCGLNIPVAVLAQQLAAGTQTVNCTTSEGPITIQQAQ